nr:hypothetical protein GCM10025732_04620 [Glycomyces mayteni]
MPQQEHPQRGLAQEDDDGGALGFGGGALLLESGERPGGRLGVDRPEVPLPEALYGHAPHASRNGGGAGAQREKRERPGPRDRAASRKR